MTMLPKIDKNFKLRSYLCIETLSSPEDITIFTDGSKMEIAPGIGIYSTNPKLDVFKSLEKYAIIITVETCAIIDTYNTNFERNP